MITARQLSDSINCPMERAAKWVFAINAAMERYSIDTPKRRAQFIAQIGHESGALARLYENLNYSAARLLEIFPRYFSSSEATKYSFHPDKIANRVYALRYGNGDEESGDGWRYRGRGLIQLTFRENYKTCGEALGVNLIHNPDMLAMPEHAAMSAAWYWYAHGCNAMADAGEIRGITRVINGGYRGLDDRIALFVRVNSILA